LLLGWYDQRGAANRINRLSLGILGQDLVNQDD
jgi:hypothetical protein